MPDRQYKEVPPGRTGFHRTSEVQRWLVAGFPSPTAEVCCAIRTPTKGEALKMNRCTLKLALLALLFSSPVLSAVEQTKGDYQDKFRQLDEVLPTANSYRTAGGEPGHEYWQQEVDYEIDVRLLEDRRRIEASERIRYTNNSPDTLRFLWLQLDQNRFRDDSLAIRSAAFADGARRGPRVEDAQGDRPPRMSLNELRRRQFMADHELGYELPSVRDARGELPHTVVGTNLRIDLRTPLAPGETTEFEIEFAFNIVEENAVSARAGYEHFPDDEREGGNDIFLLAQWFPRLHAYTDYEGWTNKEFLGRGEFTLEFGDYTVNITVPDDHIVSSTGELQNPKDVLTRTQRLYRRRDSHDGGLLALFLRLPLPDRTVGEWPGRRHGIPDDHLQRSAHRPAGRRRPYLFTLAEKRFLVGVIIHEVGHTYFPMVVNSDERQWTWMDEGLNSFLDAMAGWEWDPEIPWNNQPRDIVDYMKSEEPGADHDAVGLGTAARSQRLRKPAAALMILRETIMGRELFDFAFREYSRRWMFKRPEPADFFRTMEEASGMSTSTGSGVAGSTRPITWTSVSIAYGSCAWIPRIRTSISTGGARKKPTSRRQSSSNATARTVRAWVEQNPGIRDFL